jgi:hypothetical protein
LFFEYFSCFACLRAIKLEFCPHVPRYVWRYERTPLRAFE